MAVLGAMLQSQEAIWTCRAILKEEDFYRNSYRTLFRAIVALDDRKEPVDLITVTNELKRIGEDELAANTTGLTELIQRVPTVSNCEYYARIVKEKAYSRFLIGLMTQAVSDVYEENQEALKIAEKVSSEIMKSSAKVGVVTSYSVAHEIWDNLEKETPDYIPTGWPNLDEVLDGIRKGTLMTVTGPAYNGKSTFVQNLSCRMAKKGKKVLHLAFEGTRLEVAKRQICLMSEIRLPHFDSFDKAIMPFDAKSRAIDKWAQLGIRYGDKETMGIGWRDIRPNIFREIKKNGIEFIFIEGGEQIQLQMEFHREERWSAQERFVNDLDDITRKNKVSIVIILGQSASGSEGQYKSKREGGTNNWQKVADQRIYIKRLPENINLVEVTKNRDRKIGKVYFSGTEDTYRWKPADPPLKTEGKKEAVEHE